MRIVHAVPSLSMRTGGLAVAVVEAAVATERVGVSNCIVATDLPGTPTSRLRGPVAPEELPPRLDEIEVRIARATWPRRLAYSRELDRALAGEVRRADLVRIHSLFLFPQYAAFRHARRLGVPFVVSPHGALDPFLRPRGRLRKRIVGLLWQDRMLRNAAALHLTSDEEARLVHDIAPAVPRVVVPNGIWCDDFRDLPDGVSFRQRYLNGYRGDIVLSLGRITYKKGLDLLIRAFAEPELRTSNAVLVLAGPDDEGLRPPLEQLARELGLQERVVFTGMLNGVDRLHALGAATVWALPSHTENFGIAVVEALAAGLAAVISPAVNIAPDVQAEGAGIVAEGSPRAFAEELAGLLRDPGRRAQLGHRGRTFARRYDWSRIGTELVTAYEAVIDSDRRQA